jgi:hypothetical protein
VEWELAMWELLDVECWEGLLDRGIERLMSEVFLEPIWVGRLT